MAEDHINGVVAIIEHGGIRELPQLPAGRFNRHTLGWRQEQLNKTGSQLNDERDDKEQQDQAEDAPAKALRELLAARQGALASEAFHDNDLGNERIPNGEDDSGRDA